MQCIIETMAKTFLMIHEATNYQFQDINIYFMLVMVYNIARHIIIDPYIEAKVSL